MGSINAKLKINNNEIKISGEAKDIIEVIMQFSNNKIGAPKQIIEKPKSSLYSKEENIQFYEYLSNKGDYEIRQFEITRGKDLKKYIVCLVYDKNRASYIHANPKSGDIPNNFYTPNEVIEKLKTTDEKGFFLMHSVAERIKAKIVAERGLEEVLTKSDKVEFQNHFDIKNAVKTYLDSIMVNDKFNTDNMSRDIRRLYNLERKDYNSDKALRVLKSLIASGVIGRNKITGKTKTWIKLK